MWHEAKSFRQAASATVALLLAELRMLTGGRMLLILVVQAAWLALIAVFQHFREEPWDPVSFYNGTVLLPSLLPAIALGVSGVLAERDIRHLEMSFASAGGRYQLWCFRLCAIALAGAASCAMMATGTWLLLARELMPWSMAAHAFVPVMFVVALSSFAALALNGVPSGALVTAGAMALAFVFLHGAGASRFDPFVNPFAPPQGLLDPDAWVRTLTFNRLFLLALTAGGVAGTLWLVRRRERLL